jgi:phosphatidylserine/phosphatidylglycerophosphate/cardiolipin synthase-like enzyme
VGQDTSEVYFGGPDLAPGRLRDLLAERIAAVPAGGAIDWVTYYLRDRRLATELLRAHRRGVAVRVVLERQPRTAGANDAVIEMLSGARGLNGGLRTIKHPAVPTPPGIVWKPHLHTKLFCFSHPRPVALVGSFNPACDEPEENSRVLQALGDQDRGHNLLVELMEPRLVEGLIHHARHLHSAKHGRFEHFSRHYNQPIRGAELEAHFWPRVRANPVDALLSQIGRDARVRIAASHIKGPGVMRPLIKLAKRGAQVQLLTTSSLRRVPQQAYRKLVRAGVQTCRMPEPGGVPMHLKFLLIEGRDQHWCVFGSYNWTFRARWLNHELIVLARNQRLFDAFAARWATLWAPHSE